MGVTVWNNAPGWIRTSDLWIRRARIPGLPYFGAVFGSFGISLSGPCLWSVGDTVRDTIVNDRAAAYDPGMAPEPKRRDWTPDEVRREEQAQRARVRRDAARGVSRNLSDAVAHTEFAKRFADAFKSARRA